MSDSDDRRRFERYDENDLIVLVGNKRLFPQTILDFSLGGMRLRSPRPFMVAREVTVVINMPDEGDTQTLIGRVAWCGNVPPWELGVQFVDLSDEQRDVLTRFIAHRENRRKH